MAMRHATSARPAARSRQGPRTAPTATPDAGEMRVPQSESEIKITRHGVLWAYCGMWACSCQRDEQRQGPRTLLQSGEADYRDDSEASSSKLVVSITIVSRAIVSIARRTTATTRRRA